MLESVGLPMHKLRQEAVSFDCWLCVHLCARSGLLQPLLLLQSDGTCSMPKISPSDKYSRSLSVTDGVRCTYLVPKTTDE